MSEDKPDRITLSIAGKEIKYRYRMMNIDDVRFYRKNPRIASILALHPSVMTDAIVNEILWERNETHRLYRRIERDGGLIHPILVYRGEVLEGNTRLCCYRHLYDTTKDERWKRIKCHQILDELTQEDIYRLLCIEHIAGKIDWDAYEKANLYTKMKDEEIMTLKKISELVGESAGTVGYRIKAFRLMLKSGVSDKTKYSHFEQLVRSKDIKRIKERHAKIEDKVVELIKDEKISKAKEIRWIGDIYKHKKARKRLFDKKEDIEQVYHDLKAKAPMTDSPFMKDVEGLVTKVRGLTREEREGLERSKRDCAKIRQLMRELIRLCREIDIKVHIPKKMRKG